MFFIKNDRLWFFLQGFWRVIDDDYSLAIHFLSPLTLHGWILLEEARVPAENLCSQSNNATYLLLNDGLRRTRH